MDLRLLTLSKHEGNPSRKTSDYFFAFLIIFREFENNAATAAPKY
jgi:hypothetical protein